MYVFLKGSIYGDWCRKHSQRSQRSLRSDDESHPHHRQHPIYHHRRHHGNNCRADDHVTQEQLPLPVHDCNHDDDQQQQPEQQPTGDEVIELNRLP